MPDTTAISQSVCTEIVSSALTGHPWKHGYLQKMDFALRAQLGRKKITEPEQVIRLIQYAGGWMPVACDYAPPMVGGHERECHAAITAHRQDCEECMDIVALRLDVRHRIAAALLRWLETGSTEPAPDTTEQMPGPEGGIQLHCANCGKPYRAIRMSSRTCSGACRTALHAKRHRSQPS